MWYASNDVACHIDYLYYKIFIVSLLYQNCIYIYIYVYIILFLLIMGFTISFIKDNIFKNALNHKNYCLNNHMT